MDSLYPLEQLSLGILGKEFLYLLSQGQSSLERKKRVLFFFLNYNWNCKILGQELLGSPWAQGEPVEFPPQMEQIPLELGDPVGPGSPPSPALKSLEFLSQV